MMEKYITDERTGLKYELVGDYYLIAGDDESEEDRPIGVWGQRHLRYLKEHRRVRYANLLTSGELSVCAMPAASCGELSVRFMSATPAAKQKRKLSGI